MKFSILILIYSFLSYQAAYADGRVEKSYAKVSGQIINFPDKFLSLEIIGLDNKVTIEVDENGDFEKEIPLQSSFYGRLTKGKFVLPLYLSQRTDIQIKADFNDVLLGRYSKVIVFGDSSMETKMMLFYYQKQSMPSNSAWFALSPVDFKKKIIDVRNRNDGIIDAFINTHESIDEEFVKRFKLQVKIPLANLYFYYPIYHKMDDDTEFPDNFNVFDQRLPKNDLELYTKVYRYNVYELSYWNKLIEKKALDKSKSNQADYINAYIDKLKQLDLNQVIKDDIGFNLVRKNYKGSTDTVRSILKSRYTEIIRNESHLNEIKNNIF